jgi:integrase
MNFVDPIRDKRKITAIKNMLIGANRYRDLLLFVVGINTALRISDLLTLQVGQVVDEENHIRRTFAIQEEKRGKRNVVTINASIEQALEQYFAYYPPILTHSAHYLFFSSKRLSPIYTKPMSREHAERLISAMCQAVGLSGNYGTHTLRKTWGYHARQSGVPMEIIMEKLNHTSFAMTKRYLGITDDELKAAAEGLNL